MHIKWRIYFITLFAYAVVHSIRTMWSAIKSNLAEPPFNYQVTYLGAIDMVTLFVIAIFMNILGTKVESYGAKKCLIATLIGLFVFNTLVGLFLVLKFTARWLYVIFFALGVGISSSTAWTSCLYMVSLFFDKRNGISLSAYNGTSQLGDFISLITFFVIVSANKQQPQISFFLGSAYILIMLAVIISLIPNQLKSDLKPMENQGEEVQPQELQQEKIDEKGKCQIISEEGNKQQMISQDKKTETYSQDSQGPKYKNKQQVQQEKKVTIITVWLLPGVALNVLAYGFIKSVNSFIVSWLVYYLISLGLGSEAVLVTILWSFSVFLGGIICGVINKKLRKIFFVFQLIGATVAFILLQSFHLQVYEVQIILGIIICGLFYGGPYSLMSTAIPITLGNQQEVKQYKNGKSAIISLVQGYGLLFSGISLILIPAFGVQNIHIVGACYCSIAAFLLLGQIYRTREKTYEGHKQTQQIVKKQPLQINQK